MAELVHPKKEDFELYRILDALADPIRLEFIRKIWSVEKCCCSSFSKPVAKSTRSHHFKVLRESGLILATRNGTEFILTLRKKELDDRFPGLLDSVLSAEKSVRKSSSLKKPK